MHYTITSDITIMIELFLLSLSELHIVNSAHIDSIESPLQFTEGEMSTGNQIQVRENSRKGE